MTDDATPPPSDPAPSDPSAPHSPGDTPLSDVTTAIDARGDSSNVDGNGDASDDRPHRGTDDGQFGVVEGAQLRCFTCREVFDASTASADRLTRLEGASDPADMVAVIPVTCPNCGASGSLVLNYGAEASPDEADVLHAMDRQPSVGSPGSEPTPGIVA